MLTNMQLNCDKYWMTICAVVILNSDNFNYW